jgi:hypothetical protein
MQIIFFLMAEQEINLFFKGSVIFSNKEREDYYLKSS